MPAHRNTSETFWSKTITEPNSGCWIWLAALAADGYGLAFWRNSRLLAHRVAWEIANGRIPSPLEVVRHTCDTPLCVNPDHLLIGTQTENMADMVHRDRQARGTSQGRLTLEQVNEIRARAARGDRHADIAREIGCSETQAYRIATGRSWSWL